MRFVKVTAWIWLGLIGAGFGLAAFGLEKLPIMSGLIWGCAIGQLCAAREIAANPGYAVKANIIALLPALIIVVVAMVLFRAASDTPDAVQHVTLRLPL